jgi:hypothetical protein
VLVYQLVSVGHNLIMPCIHQSGPSFSLLCVFFYLALQFDLLCFTCYVSVTKLRVVLSLF